MRAAKGEHAFLITYCVSVDYILYLQALWSHLREEQNILDGWRVGHEHCQTVNSHTES